MTVERLEDLAVRVGRPVGKPPRVEIIDTHRLVEVVSLSPSEASTLAGMLVAQAAQAGWVVGHAPGAES